MRFKSGICWHGLVLALGLVRLAFGGGGTAPCQSCQAPDGCCLRDVVSHRCVLVPDKKQIKKTVYECKDIPFCLHRLPKFGECDCCPECIACPQYKKVLIKREVVVAEICTTKCIIDEFVESVPGPCCHCGHHSVVEKSSGQAIPSEPQPPMPPAETKSSIRS